MNYFEYRDPQIEGVDSLLWITDDRGAWDGPLEDWKQGAAFFMDEVRSFGTVIQAGGNCGMYARFYGNYFKHVVSFEPEPANFFCLLQNCPDEEYTVCMGALGDTRTMLHLQKSHVTNVGMHKIMDIPGNVNMYRLDDIQLDSCDLIHLDIEGYEAEALRGARETIEEFKPVVIVEKGSGNDVLLDMGYKCVKMLRMDHIYVHQDHY